MYRKIAFPTVHINAISVLLSTNLCGHFLRLFLAPERKRILIRFINFLYKNQKTTTRLT